MRRLVRKLRKCRASEIRVSPVIARRVDASLLPQLKYALACGARGAGWSLGQLVLIRPLTPNNPFYRREAVFPLLCVNKGEATTSTRSVPNAGITQRRSCPHKARLSTLSARGESANSICERPAFQNKPRLRAPSHRAGPERGKGPHRPVYGALADLRTIAPPLALVGDQSSSVAHLRSSICLNPSKTERCYARLCVAQIKCSRWHCAIV